MQPQQPSSGGLVYYTNQPGVQHNYSSSPYVGSPNFVQYGGGNQPSVNYYQAPPSPVKSYVTDNNSDIFFSASPTQRIMGNQNQGQTYRIVTGNKDGSNANEVYTNVRSYDTNNSYQPQQQIQYSSGGVGGGYTSQQGQIAAYPMGSTSAPQKIQISGGHPTNTVVVGGSSQEAIRVSPQPPQYQGISYSQQSQPQVINYQNQNQPTVINYSSSPQMQSQQSYAQPTSYVQQKPQVMVQKVPMPHNLESSSMQVRPQPSQVPTHSQPQIRHNPQSDQNKPQKRREIPSTERNSFSMENGIPMEGPPQFVAQPKNSITVMEGDPITISARVKPAGDSSLKCEWYRNGKPLSAASRFNPTFDRGYAVLEFLYTNEDDNGDYYCVAENNLGRDQSSICHITVHSAEGVVTDTQLPEESMVANLAAMEEYLEQTDLMRNRRIEEDRVCQQPPTFLRQPVPQLGLRDNNPAHFECIVEPAGDPNLVVEWYKDGKPVSMGCRFNATLDRGYAILDIMYCRAEDSGQYCCVAKNPRGTVQSNIVQLNCTEDGGIITQSALSKDSIAYLESLDSWNSDAMVAYDGRPAPEDQEEPSAPTFVILPKQIVAVEGTPARFLVRADGNPRPRIQWYINGDLIASSGQGGNWRIFQDGGISYLEFHRCGHPATYQIRIVAKNQHGEAATETTLTIEPQIDYRPDLKHVTPENNFKKLMALRHVDVGQELMNKMHKPKADAIELRKIERTSEYKGRASNISEVEETENLYMRVQQSLKSGRSSVPPMIPLSNEPQKPVAMTMGTGSQQNITSNGLAQQKQEGRSFVIQAQNTPANQQTVINTQVYSNQLQNTIQNQQFILKQQQMNQIPVNIQNPKLIIQPNQNVQLDQQMMNQQINPGLTNVMQNTYQIPNQHKTMIIQQQQQQQPVSSTHQKTEKMVTEDGKTIIKTITTTTTQQQQPFQTGIQTLEGYMMTENQPILLHQQITSNPQMQSQPITVEQQQYLPGQQPPDAQMNVQNLIQALPPI